MTILNDVKNANGVNTDNLGFDKELLITINSVKGNLVHLGLTEYDLIEIEDDTEWLDLSDPTLSAFVKQYFVLKTKETFDPIPSETVAKGIANTLMLLEGRIMHTIEQKVG